LFEDGAAQEIASFDASATPASIALVLDVSPSIFRELAEIRAPRTRSPQIYRLPTNRRRLLFPEAHLLLPFFRRDARCSIAPSSRKFAGGKIRRSRISMNRYFSRAANCFAAAPPKSDRPTDPTARQRTRPHLGRVSAAAS